MTDELINPETVVSSQQPQKNKTPFWLSAVSVIVGLFAVCLIALLALLGSDSGTKWVLNEVATQQKLVTFDYVQGNFQDGIIVENFKVGLESTDILAKKIHVRMGWRSILRGQVHLVRTTVDDLVIDIKTPPTGKPFKYSPIQMPIGLRINNGIVNGLTIKQPVYHPVTRQLVPRVDVIFLQAHLKKATWHGDLLTLTNSSIRERSYEADHFTGTMQFNGHYPINLKAQASLPLLAHIGAPKFQVDVTGDLEQIHGELSVMKSKGVMQGQVDIRPMDRVFGLKGQVTWRELHWPILQQENLYSKSGTANVQSTPHGLGIDVRTDLVGTYVAKGKYLVKLFTNYTNLEIQSIDVKAAKGTMTGHGLLEWQKDVSWFVQGQLTNIHVADALPLSLLPYAQYLPKTFTGPFKQIAVISPHQSQIGVSLKSAKGGEHWRVGIARLGSLADSTLPLAVDVRLDQFSHEFAGVGQVNAQRAEAMVILNQDRLTVDTKVDLLKSQHLPAGLYTASLITQPNGFKFPTLTFNGDIGAVEGSANMVFATLASDKKSEKTMSWAANLSTKGLDIASIVQSPIKRLKGSVNVTGKYSAAQHLINVKPALTGTLKTDAIRSNPSSTNGDITLTGQGQLVLSNHTAKNKQGLKAYTAKFEGDLKNINVPSGQLKILVSGTPELTKVEQFEHDGVAGQISATGQVATKNGVQWNATAKLNRFNIGFFLPSYPSDLTGSLNTRGQWSGSDRQVYIDQLDLSGSLKNQLLRAKGSLQASFNPKSLSPVPDKLIANHFILDWAGNRLTANGGTTMNAQGIPVGILNMQIDARNLGQIHPDMSGRILGTVDLSGQALSPDAQVNINIDNFKYSALAIKKASLIGRIPQLGLQPSQLVLTLSDLKHEKQVLNHVRAVLSGTQKSHTLSLSTEAPKTQFSIQLAGGLDENMNWLGDIRQGVLTSKKMTLKQDSPAIMQYQSTQKMFSVNSHCWSGMGRFCLTDQLLVSPASVRVALTLNELDLSGFYDMMPSGMIWSGKLQGNVTANWQPNTPVQLNANVTTDNGFIGLDPDDPQDAPSTLPYQRLSLLVSTQEDGIKLRFDAKTPNIGTGYIDALIDPKAAVKTINGALVLDDVQLKVLKPFFPGIRELSGIASLAGGMSGPLTNPAFYGNFKLTNGKVVAIGIPLNLNNINLNAAIRGSQATLTSQFMSGDGAGSLAGSANWMDKPIIDLKLVGKELIIRQPPMLNAAVSPTLNVQILPEQKQVTIDGRIDIPFGIISPGVKSSAAIYKSADVRIVNVDQSTTASVLKNVKAWSINTDIDVVVGRDLRFRGFGANARIDGKLKITQRGTEGLMAAGKISLEPNAKVDAYGQELVLTKSNIFFKGSLLEPKVDIKADKVIDSRTVGIIIQGSAANPKISTWNNAGLTDQETYSAILSGYISTSSNAPSSTFNNTALVRAGVDNALAAAGISAGLSGSRNLTNQFGSAIGLSNLTFGADGSDGDTKVNVTGYLSPSLYVRYGVGVFTPVNKLTLRYRMSQRFYMEASSSIERAIDFFYGWNF